MKNNQKGFGAVEALIIVVIVGFMGFAGWYIWQKNSTKNDTAQTNSTKQDKDNSTKENKDKTEDKYLEIKEWGVRFKLNSAAKGAYYTFREGGEYADVSDKDFDALKNTNGVSCKGEVLFVVGRYSDANSEELINRETVAVDGYLYAGSPAHQAPPRCAVLSTDTPTETEYDQNILDKFNVYKMGIDTSFKSLQAID